MNTKNKFTKIVSMILLFAVLLVNLEVSVFADKLNSTIEHEEYILENLGGNRLQIVEYRGDYKNIIIPEEVEGKKVIGIKDSVFKTDGKEIEVIRARNLDFIKENNFNNFKVGSLEIESVGDLSGNTFNNIEVIESVDFRFPKIEKIKDKVFTNFSTEENIIIPKEVKSFESSGFLNTLKLNEDKSVLFLNPNIEIKNLKADKKLDYTIISYPNSKISKDIERVNTSGNFTYKDIVEIKDTFLKVNDENKKDIVIGKDELFNYVSTLNINNDGFKEMQRDIGRKFDIIHRVNKDSFIDVDEKEIDIYIDDEKVDQKLKEQFNIEIKDEYVELRVPVALKLVGKELKVEVKGKIKEDTENDKLTSRNLSPSTQVIVNERSSKDKYSIEDSSTSIYLKDQNSFKVIHLMDYMYGEIDEVDNLDKWIEEKSKIAEEKGDVFKVSNIYGKNKDLVKIKPLQKIKYNKKGNKIVASSDSIDIKLNKEYDVYYYIYNSEKDIEDKKFIRKFITEDKDGKTIINVKEDRVKIDDKNNLVIESEHGIKDYKDYEFLAYNFESGLKENMDKNIISINNDRIVFNPIKEEYDLPVLVYKAKDYKLKDKVKYRVYFEHPRTLNIDMIEKEGKIGEVLDVYKLAKEMKGLEIDKTNTISNYVLLANNGDEIVNNIHIYYKEKDSVNSNKEKYILKHVDSNKKELLPKEIKFGQVGYKVEESAVEIDKYKVVGDKTKSIVLDGKSPKEIIFEYKKEGSTGNGGNGGSGGNGGIILPEVVPELNRKEHMQYIEGYPDNTIKGDSEITREEVAAVFFRLLDPKYRDEIRSYNNNFMDISVNRWSNKHISTLTNAKIMTGYEDGTFRPTESITRGEIAAIAARFNDMSKGTNKKFLDVEGHWSNKYIEIATESGWLKGYEDGTFKPNQNLTRGEFVSLVNKMLDRKVRLENILPGVRKFKDLNTRKWYYEDIQEAVNGHEYEEKRLNDNSEKWIRLKDFNVEM